MALFKSQHSRLYSFLQASKLEVGQVAAEDGIGHGFAILTIGDAWIELCFGQAKLTCHSLC